MPPYRMSILPSFFEETSESSAYSPMDGIDDMNRTKPYLSLTIPYHLEQESKASGIPSALSVPSTVSCTSIRLPRFELEYLDDRMRAMAIASTSCYPMQMRNAVLHSTSRPIALFRCDENKDFLLGNLSILPHEILEEIFFNLDLTSVFICRAVSVRMRAYVDGLLKFQRVLKYGLETISALFDTGAASDYTFRHLYYLLCRPGCKICGNFGPLLFIPGRHRCCMGCLRTHIGLMPMTTDEAYDAFGLTEKDLKEANVPIVQTLEGVYGFFNDEREPRPGRCVVKQRNTTRIVSRVLARKIFGNALTPSQRRRKELYEKNVLQKFRADFKVTQSLLPRDALASIEGLTIDHVYRFQSATFFPYFDQAKSKVEELHACGPCQSYYPAQYELDTFADLCAWIQDNSAIFNEDGLLEHLRQCRHM